MANVKQYEGYVRGRLKFFEQQQKDANPSEQDQFDLTLAELRHIYVEIIPQLEDSDGSRLRSGKHGR